MNDQAVGLRQRMMRKKTDKHAKTIAVASGKGGVGKSNFTLNLALKLSEHKKKVLIFDLDIGMGNIDILMGVAPKYSIIDMFSEDSCIENILETGPNAISYIAGGSGLKEIFQMDTVKFHIFNSQFEVLSSTFDYILFDMGAGVTTDTLHFMASANEIVLVTTPEPTSITDGYALMKHIVQIDSQLPISVFVNRVYQKKQGQQTFTRLQTVMKRFLDKDINYLGMIPDDLHILKAVHHQEPFVIHAPSCPASRAIDGIAMQILSGTSGLSTVPSQSFISKLKSYFIPKS